MKSFSVRTQGLTQVLSKIERYDKRISDGIDDELTTAANNVAESARANAPKGGGNYKVLLGIANITSDIYAHTSKKFSKKVGVNNPIAAYVEFGTGSRVFQGSFSFSPEQKDFARLFYVSGKGRTP